MKKLGLFYSSILLALLAAARFAGAPLIHQTVQEPNAHRLIKGLGVLMAIAVALVVDRLFRRLYLDGHLRRRMGRETPALIEGLITVALLSLGGSIGLYIEAGVPFTGLITASGATAVVLGLALQEAIKDVFGGLSLNIDGSIIIGDWLTVYSEQFHEPVHGRVQGITWRSTILRLTDGRRLVVPNHVMTTHPVMNHSRPPGPKRLEVEIPIAAQYPAERAMGILLAEAFRIVHATKILSRIPEPDIFIDRMDMTTAFLKVRFYSDPDKIDPDDARPMVLRALHEAMLRHKIPQPVNRMEFGAASGDADPELEQARAALANASLFKDSLDAEQLDTLISASGMKTIPGETVFIRQGEAGASMFLLLEGVARVSIDMPDGEVRDVAILMSGDIMGEMSLMTGAPRTATVTSVTAMRVLEVTKAAIEPLLAAQPGLLERLSKVLAVRQSGLSEIANSPGQKHALERDLLDRMREFFSRVMH